MKRFYSLIAIAIMALVSLTTSAQVKSAERVSDISVASMHKITDASKMNRVSKVKSMSPLAAPQKAGAVTAADIEGEYDWRYYSYIDPTGAASGTVTITAKSATEVEIVGFYSTFPVTATVSEDGTISIPNQFMFTNTYYNKDVWFYHNRWADDGKSQANSEEPLVGTFANDAISFDDYDNITVQIPGEGYFLFAGDNSLAKHVDVEEDPADWEECGTADLMDGWVLTCYGINQAQNIIKDIVCERNIKEEGVYRLVNPFKGDHPCASENQTTVENGYIKFSIADPEFPFIYSGIPSGFGHSELGGELYCHDLNGYYHIASGYDKNTILTNVTSGLSTYNPDRGVLTIPTALFGITGETKAAYSWQDSQGNSVDMTASIKLNFVETVPEAPNKDITIDFTAQGWSNRQTVTTLTQDGIELTFAKANGRQDPAYYTASSSFLGGSTDAGIRLYAKSTINIKGVDETYTAIKKIVFTTSEKTYVISNPTWSTGTYDGTSKTWTGETLDLLFTQGGSNYACIQKMVLTVDYQIPPVEAEYTVTPQVNEDNSELTGIKLTGLDELTVGTGVITVANGEETVGEFDADAVEIENGEATLTLDNAIVGPATVTITIPQAAFMKGQAEVLEKVVTVTLNEPTPVDAEYTVTPVVNEAQSEMTAVQLTGLDELTVGTGVITVAKGTLTVAEFNVADIAIENGEATLTLENTIVGPAEVTITIPTGAFMKGNAKVNEKVATVTLNEPLADEIEVNAVVDATNVRLLSEGSVVAFMCAQVGFAGKAWMNGDQNYIRTDVEETIPELGQAGSYVMEAASEGYFYLRDMTTGKYISRSAGKGAGDYCDVVMVDAQADAAEFQIVPTVAGNANVFKGETTKTCQVLAKAMDSWTEATSYTCLKPGGSDVPANFGASGDGPWKLWRVYYLGQGEYVEPETPATLVYEANGVVGDGQGVNTNIPFYNTAVKVEAYDNNTVVIKAWDGVEGSDLKIAYAGIAQGDEVFQAIIGIEQTVDGEVVSEVMIDDEDEESSYVTLYPQSETYPMVGVLIYNEMTGIRLEDAEDGTHMGQLSLFGAWYVAGGEEGVDPGFGMGEPSYMHYMVTWPAEPVVVPEPSKFDSETLYTLGTKRGYLPATETLTTLWEGANYIVSTTNVEEAGKFQITGNDGAYYLYNTDVKKYLSADGTPQSVYVEEANGTFSIIPATEVGGNEGAWIIKSNVTGKWMMFGGSSQFLNDDGWNAADDGDQWFITEAPAVVAPADLTCDYTLNAGKTQATVTVEGLTGTGVVAYYFGDDFDEPAGYLGDEENTFEVGRPDLENACSVKVTVREYSMDDTENMTVVAEGVVLVEFPAPVVPAELTLSYTLNEGTTQATVTVEGLTGTGVVAYYFDNDLNEAAGFLGDGETTFEVARPENSEEGIYPASSIVLTVCEYDMNDTTNATVVAEGTITIEFPYLDTAVNSINAVNNAVIFNLNGQKVSRLQKGLYIINGQKTVVK